MSMVKSVLRQWPRIGPAGVLKAASVLFPLCLLGPGEAEWGVEHGWWARGGRKCVSQTLNPKIFFVTEK